MKYRISLPKGCSFGLRNGGELVGDYDEQELDEREAARMNACYPGSCTPLDAPKPKPKPKRGRKPKAKAEGAGDEPIEVPA